MRAWSSGWALAFQANEASSILAARSNLYSVSSMVERYLIIKGIECLFAPIVKLKNLMMNSLSRMDDYHTTGARVATEKM